MKLPREVLKIIFEKTNGHCWYCGITIHPLDNWQVDHQQPRSQGGTDEIENLVPSCRSCNAGKGGRTVEQYRHSLVVRLEHAITSAFEICQELSGKTQPPLVAHDPNWPLESLDRIASLLSHAADTAINLQFEFYGEQELRFNDCPSIPTIEAEKTI